MYAVIKTGGKQYKVAANDEIIVEKIDANTGDEFAFEEILMLGDGDDVTVGAPVVKGAAVVCEILDQGKGDKVIIFKKRQRSTYRRKNGHRQLQTVVKITSIHPEGIDLKKLKKADPDAAPTTAKEEAPAKKAAPAAEAPKAEKAPAKKAEPAKASAGSDDLTQLKGVGPAYAKKLNEAGITSFAQIAALDAAGVTELEEKLNASGRVERDGWIDQAKELAK
jgi:large subunit ribosomal protein L21